MTTDLRGRCWGHVPREPRDRRPGRPGAGPLLGGAARRQHAERRARPVRDPAHGARRARAGPVLPDRARAARPRPAAAPRRQRRRPPGRGRAARPRPRRAAPRHRPARRPLGGARRPGGQPVLRHGGACGVRDLRPDRGASARQCRPGPRRGVLGRAVGLAARLQRHARGPAPSLGPRGAARAVSRARPEAGRLQEPAAPRHPARGGRRRARRRGAVVELGGHERDHDWGELPWRVVTDPSGNELCLLPARDA